jgi:tellurite resistance protein
MSNTTTNELEAHAEAIRKDLKVKNQSELFKCAVEAGFLAALADGEVDAGEKRTMVRAVELLSKGSVIEWETEALLDECADRVGMQGHAARAEAVGAELKRLGQAEAGLLVAAFVARATNGIDKREAEVLKQVGKAAGLAAKQVGEIVKRAGLIDEP